MQNENLSSKDSKNIDTNSPRKDTESTASKPNTDVNLKTIPYRKTAHCVEMTWQITPEGIDIELYD